MYSRKTGLLPRKKKSKLSKLSDLIKLRTGLWRKPPNDNGNKKGFPWIKRGIAELPRKENVHKEPLPSLMLKLGIRYKSVHTSSSTLQKTSQVIILLSDRYFLLAYSLFFFFFPFNSAEGATFFLFLRRRWYRLIFVLSVPLDLHLLFFKIVGRTGKNPG